MRNEQLDGFQYGESNLRGTAYENGGLEGSRATVHEKAPAYRVMNKRAGTGMRGGHVTCINFVATRIKLKTELIVSVDSQTDSRLAKWGKTRRIRPR